METQSISNSSGSTLRIRPHDLGFFHPDRNLGVRGLSLRLILDEREVSVRYSKVQRTEEGLVATGTVGNCGVICRTELRLLEEADAATVRHTLTNQDEEQFHHLREIRSTQSDAGLWVPFRRPYDLRYCHTDNVRTERYPFCQTESPYVRSLPTRTLCRGTGEDQPFPAIYFTDRDYNKGLVIGALDQRKTYQSFRMRREARPDESIFDIFEIRHELPMTRGYTLDLGESLELDGFYIELTENTHPQNAYRNYIDRLARTHDFRGRHTNLLEEAFFCTWNYGRGAEQVEEELLTTARFISENFPRMKYFLVDAGYTFREVDRTGLPTNDSLDVMYNGPDQMLDPEKIPDMRAFTGRIRDLGLKPGLWWTPTAQLYSNLFRDHPDWYLRDATGAPYRIGTRKGFLDLTVPDARDFVDRTLGVILEEWGMEATKMDFWSQAFEDRDARLAAPNATAAETRRILFDLVRKHLPEDGVFMTCVAVGMGNPFIAEHADTYRNTIDIGAGDWYDQIGACYWALPVLSIEGRKTFLHNNDSVGVNLECPENENFFRLTWCFITMGMQEVGGQLEDLPDKYVRAMRKYTDRCERGFRCLCPDEKAYRGEPLPECLYVDYPEGSRTRGEGIRQSVALFNWSDRPKMISVRRAELGHDAPVEAENFWTEEKESFAEEFITRRLGPRSAALFDILE
jgi:hypothetical protein